MEKQEQHSKNSAELDHHLEHLPEFFSHLKGNDLFGEDEMSCAGDGEPFGDPLDDAVERRLETFDDLHEHYPFTALTSVSF